MSLILKKGIVSLFLLLGIAQCQIPPLSPDSVLPSVITAHLIPNYDVETDPAPLIDPFDETEVFIEFDAPLNFTALNLLETDQFPCSDLFEFFQGQNPSTLTEKFEIEANCRICPQGEDVEKTSLAILVLPTILVKEEVGFVDTYFVEIGDYSFYESTFGYFPYLDREENPVVDGRLLQDDQIVPLDLNLVKGIQTKSLTNVLPTPMIELPDFGVVSANHHTLTSIAFEFTEPVQMIRGAASVETVDVFCTDIFANLEESNLTDCELTFQDKFLFVEFGKDVSSLEFISFKVDSPSFFSLSEKFGIKQMPVVEHALIRRPGMLSVSVSERNERALSLSFTSKMLQQNVGRKRCNFFMDFVDVNDQRGMFTSRPDLFCSLRWLNPRSAELVFTDLVPFFEFRTWQTRLNFGNQFKFLKANGLGTALVREPPRSISQNIAHELILNGPRTLTRCDTEFNIEVTPQSTVPLLMVFSVSESLTVNGQFVQIPLPSPLCKLVGQLVSCFLSQEIVDFISPQSPPSTIEYSITVQGRPVVLPGELASEAIASATIDIVHDFTEIVVPVTLAGVDIVEGARAERGTPSTFTAVLGNVFGCVGNVASSQVSFTWRVADDDFVVDVTRTGKLLSLTGNEFPVGDYTITFTASPQQGSELELSGVSERVITFSYTVLPAQVVVVSSAGAQQVVEQGKDVVLDATRSCDPNNAELPVGSCQAGLGFINNLALNQALAQNDDEVSLRELTGMNNFNVRWNCVDCGTLDEAEVFAGVNNEALRVVIPFSNFQGENSSNFEFAFFAEEILNAGNSKSVNLAVDVVEPLQDCFVPSVTISPIDAVVNGNQAIIVRAKADPPAGVKFQWVEEEGDDVSVFDKLADKNARFRKDLFLAEGSLADGVSYRFTLNVFANCDVNKTTGASASVSFAVNARPFGGVLNIEPQVGDALTKFTLTTSGWQDEDLPLRFAFEAFYLPDGKDLADIEEFSPAQTTPLAQFSQNPVVKTQLQTPPPGTSLVVIAVARDARGAVSRRLVANSFAGVVINNPFVQNGVPNLDNLNVDLIIGLIDDLVNSGDPTLIPNLCSAVTSALNDIADVISGLGIGQNVLDQVTNICFTAVTDLINLEDPNVALDSDVVNLVASSVSQITENPDQLNEQLLEQVDAQTSNLIQAMRAEVERNIRGDEDPAAGGLIPDSFRQNIADVVSNILGASVSLFEEVDSVIFQGDVRRLQEINKASCTILNAARNNVVDISNLQTGVLTNGAPQVDVESRNVQFATMRENSADVGGDLRNTIVVPDEVGGFNEITLPPELAERLRELNGGNDTDLTVLAAKWKVDIRCEPIVPDEPECLQNYTYDGPREGATGNVVSLDFFPEDSPNDGLTVDSLAEPIIIFLDLPAEIAESSEVLAIIEECKAEVDERNLDNEVRTTELVEAFKFECGFFDEVTSEFTTQFCQVGNNGLPVSVDGVPKIVCECFHATDYAAWQSFKYDIRRTLNSQIVLSDLAKLVLLVIVPIVLILMLILLMWAYYRDKKDAKNILRGALARIKLIRIIKNRQKRQFFDHVKEAEALSMLGVQDHTLDLSTKLQQSVAVKKEEESIKKKHRAYLLTQFFLAIKYEHSLFGLSRYDPNFSRVQRVIVFIAVVISNFGAAAFIFELRSNVYEISVFVTVAVSFLAAMMVGVPVKLIARTLFKTTDNKAGSQHDQVNSMYKIITRLETADGVESEKDLELVEAIHKYHVAEKMLKKSVFKSQPTLAQQGTVETQEVQVVNVSDNEDLPQADVVEVFKQAKSSLNLATISARNAWKEAKSKNNISQTFYTNSWRRLKSLRPQSSRTIKLMSLFAGDATKAAKPRDSRFPHFLVWLDYVFLLLLVLFYAFYTVQFVGTRAERAEDPFPGNLDADFEPVSEQEYIIQWAIGGAGGILISYLIAEPIIALLRYIFLPWVMSKCGKKKVEEDDLNINELRKQTFREDKPNIREDKLQGAFDVLADIVESLF